MLFTGLALIIFSNFLLPTLSEYIDPADCKIVFYYGPTYDDSTAYPLAEAAAIVAHSEFVPELPLVWFIPDYHEPQLDGYQSHYTIDAYLQSNDVNMVFIDWGAPITDPDKVKDPFLPALVPMCTNWLLEIHQVIDWDLVHVVAYAKGAEFIANIVEDLFRRSGLRIHRITQLAPPKEFIVDGKQVDEDKDLITNFIDAIHTNIGDDGANVSRAHVDFYPNGGTDPQPGCAGGAPLCSRRRAFLYYAESVNNNQNFCAYKANSYQEFEATDDKSTLGQPITMGRYVPHSARGNYFLDTNSSPPYGQGC